MQGIRKTYTQLMGVHKGQLLWKSLWRFLKKLEIGLPYDPAVSLLDPKDSIFTSEILALPCSLILY